LMYSRDLGSSFSRANRVFTHAGTGNSRGRPTKQQNKDKYKHKSAGGPFTECSRGRGRHALKERLLLRPSARAPSLHGVASCTTRRSATERRGTPSTESTRGRARSSQQTRRKSLHASAYAGTAVKLPSQSTSSREPEPHWHLLWPSPLMRSSGPRSCRTIR
jgi:hypothetical protein